MASLWITADWIGRRRVLARGRGGVQSIEEWNRVLQAYLHPKDLREAARSLALCHWDLPEAGERGVERSKAEVVSREGGKGSKGEEKSSKEVVTKVGRPSDGLRREDERRPHPSTHATQRNMDRLAIATHQTARTHRCQHQLTSLAQDLPTIKWSTATNKIRKILGEIALHGQICEDWSRWPRASWLGGQSHVSQISQG